MDAVTAGSPVGGLMTIDALGIDEVQSRRFLRRERRIAVGSRRVETRQCESSCGG